jgi:hypothetical protein
VAGKKQIKYDFSPNSLFRAGPHPHLNAYIPGDGWEHTEIDYGNGFYQGGVAIVNAVIDGASPDLLLYPAAFSFRHGIELYLKFILKSLIRLNSSKRTFSKNHDIPSYFSSICEEFSSFNPPIIDPIDLSIAKDIIDDFRQIDPTGQVFRYPEDVWNNKHLVGIKLINVGILGEGMEVLFRMFSTWLHQIGMVEDYRRGEP